MAESKIEWGILVEEAQKLLARFSVPARAHFNSDFTSKRGLDADGSSKGCIEILVQNNGDSNDIGRAQPVYEALGLMHGLLKPVSGSLVDTLVVGGKLNDSNGYLSKDFEISPGLRIKIIARLAS